MIIIKLIFDAFFANPQAMFQNIINDLWNVSWDIVKAIIAGGLSFAIAYFVLTRNKKKDDEKEDERLRNIRMSLYYNFKFIRFACKNQIKHMQVVIKEMELNKKNTLSVDDIIEQLSNEKSKELQINIFKRKAYLSPLTLDFGVVPTHINKFSPEDFYKILVHTHANIETKRINNVQTFLINTDILSELAISLKDLQDSLADDFNKNKQYIIDNFDKVNFVIDRYWHNLKVEFADQNLTKKTIPKYYVELKKMYDDLIMKGYQKTYTLEDTMKYLDEIMKLSAENINEKHIESDLQEVAKYSKNAFRFYNEIFVTQFSQLDGLKAMKSNFEDVVQNILNILKQEYPELEYDYDIK